MYIHNELVISQVCRSLDPFDKFTFGYGEFIHLLLISSMNQFV